MFLFFFLSIKEKKIPLFQDNVIRTIFNHQDTNISCVEKKVCPFYHLCFVTLLLTVMLDSLFELFIVLGEWCSDKYGRDSPTKSFTMTANKPGKKNA